MRFDFDKHTEKTIKVFLLHLAIGVILGLNRNLGIIYLVLAFAYFTYQVLKVKDKTYWVLAAGSYFASAEVFMRMTRSMPFWEMGKYLVIFFMLLGIFFQGIRYRAWPIGVFILLMVPGIYIAYLNYDFIEDSFRKAMLFNLSGPLSLAMTALFCYQRKVDFNQIMRLVDVMIYPIFGMCIYIIIKSPSLAQIEFTTESNQAASGGFSGNQVATILGLGIFLAYTRFLIPHKNFVLKIFNSLLIVLFAYRGLLTFSRGGILVGVLMIMFFTIQYLNWAPLVAKAKAFTKLIALGVGAFIVWSFALVVTGGLILNRYTGKNVKGEQKDITTGRGEIFATEIAGFYEDPFWGLGVGIGKFYREETMGFSAASHNEVGRMIGEHGMLGIIALILLIVVPIFIFLLKPSNLFIIPFTIFWFATINHSAMRIALPGFFYGYALLDIYYAKKNKKKQKKKPSLPRKQVSSEEPQLNPS